MKDVIDQNVIKRLPLENIDRVTFYKRDEMTTDLICCDIEIGGRNCFFHEQELGWELLLRHLEQLPRFKMDWLEAVSQPAFAKCETVAFERI